MRMTKPIAAAATLVLSVLIASSAYAGPVILGGDDLTDHGSVSGGVNQEGWLYIEKAVDSILNTPGNITRPGNDGSIAALGSAESSATSDNAGAAIGSAAQVLGKTVKYYDGPAAINGFFAMLAAGTENPALIWLAGTRADNDLDSDEGEALTANAMAIAAFVNSGGGLMAHGSGEDAYGWLGVVLPGLQDVEGCESDGATLTPAGQQAFPGLSNSDIDDNAGPCHSHFEGDFGTLQVLALDGSDPRVPYIIGGGAGTVIGKTNPAPVMGGWAFGGLAGLLLLGGAWLAGRKSRRV